jgi:hypothetical protein
MNTLFKIKFNNYLLRPVFRNLSSGPLKDKETAEEKFFFDKEESILT